MTSYFPRFVCPKCACEQLVEVHNEETNAIWLIKHTDDDREEIIYDGDHDANRAGYIEFSCAECYSVIKDRSGEPLQGSGELGYWLTDQAEARMASIKFTCPTCGGHQLDDNVKFADEGSGGRFFCCHDCGEVVCDQDESTLRKILEWGHKCSAKRQQLPSGS